AGWCWAVSGAGAAPSSVENFSSTLWSSPERMSSTSFLVASKTFCSVAVTWARLTSSALLASPLPASTAAPAVLRWAAMTVIAAAPWAWAPAFAAARGWASFVRPTPGAGAAGASPSFLAARASSKAGSLPFFSWSSVTWASAIWASTWRGPSEKSVAAGGALSGMAFAGSGAPGAGGGRSGTSGVTGLSLAAAVSGGALVVVVMAAAEAFLPSVTLPWTAPLIAPAL